MRATRYLWISNLPVRTSEQDIRDVLQRYILRTVSIPGYFEVSYSAVVIPLIRLWSHVLM